MKRIGFLAFACGLLFAGALPVQAQDVEAAVFAPIQQFVNGMNARDLKQAAAAYTPSTDIIDEFAPHHWSSFAGWAKDLDGFFKANGVADFHMALSAPSHKDVSAGDAYAVAPATLTYRVHGNPTVEKGLFTFSLARTEDGWRITGWAWSTL